MGKTKTSWKTGQSGNPNGRPPSGHCIIDKFRDDPRSEKVIDKVYKTALTLGLRTEHKYAMTCAKLIVDKLIPTLKASEIDIEQEIKERVKQIHLDIDRRGMEIYRLWKSKLYNPEKEE